MSSSQPPSTYRRPRHIEKERRWELPLILAGIMTLVVIIGLAVWAFLPGKSSIVAGDPADVAISTTTSTTTAGPVPSDATPTPTEQKDDLVAQAREVKPLEDLDPGDRVLYQEHLCYWRAWMGSVSTSKIECTEGDPFQIQTARLTPVERKSGPSDLKIRHS